MMQAWRLRRTSRSWQVCLSNSPRGIRTRARCYSYIANLRLDTPRSSPLWIERTYATSRRSETRSPTTAVTPLPGHLVNSLGRSPTPATSLDILGSGDIRFGNGELTGGARLWREQDIGEDKKTE